MEAGQLVVSARPTCHLTRSRVELPEAGIAATPEGRVTRPSFPASTLKEVKYSAKRKPAEHKPGNGQSEDQELAERHRQGPPDGNQDAKPSRHEQVDARSALPVEGTPSRKLRGFGGDWRLRLTGGHARMLTTLAGQLARPARIVCTWTPTSDA